MTYFTLSQILLIASLFYYLFLIFVVFPKLDSNSEIINDTNDVDVNQNTDNIIGMIIDNEDFDSEIALDASQDEEINPDSNLIVATLKEKDSTLLHNNSNSIQNSTIFTDENFDFNEDIEIDLESSDDIDANSEEDLENKDEEDLEDFAPKKLDDDVKDTLKDIFKKK